MPQKLSENQIDKMVAIMAIDSLLGDALENYLGEDLLDELDELDIDGPFEKSKLKLVKDLIAANGLTKKELLAGSKKNLSDFIKIVK